MRQSTTLEPKFFTEPIYALRDVTGGLRTIVNLSEEERETIRRTLDDIYRVIDTTLNIVIIRLGDILLRSADGDFLRSPLDWALPQLDGGRAGAPSVQLGRVGRMTDHNLFYYSHASFTNAQLPLRKMAALFFDKLVILDPVGANWVTIGADYHARDAVVQLTYADILQTMTSAEILAKFAGLRLCVHHGHPGAEWLLDWRGHRRTVIENGLHCASSL